MLGRLGACDGATNITYLLFFYKNHIIDLVLLGNNIKDMYDIIC